MKILLFFCCVVCFCQPVYAGTLTLVPPATPPPFAVPVNGNYVSECVGVSNAGVAACNTTYIWCTKVNRWTRCNYKNYASLYAVATGVGITVKPWPLFSETKVFGMTRGGRVYGQSTSAAGAKVYVQWDAQGNPTALPGGIPGEITGCDDHGSCASGDKLFNVSTGVYEVVPGAIKLWLDSSGESVGLFTWPDAGGVEHTGLYRTNDFLLYGEEDACVYPCIGEPWAVPAKMLTNGPVVGFYFSGFTYGYRDRAQDFVRTDNALWSGINTAGDLVGSDKILHIDGTLETIPLSLGFTTLNALGVNDSGLVVGTGNRGTDIPAYPVVTRHVAFIYTF